MSEKKVRRLENFEDLFGLEPSGNQDKKEHKEIELSKLVPFENHPFKPYEGKKLDDMVESIRENGVITPIVVRPKEGDVFEILSGHNRVNAAKSAGLATIPAIIKEGLSDAEAKIIVTDTNFMQRSVADMLPSELAKSFKMQLEACKEAKQKQGLLKELESVANHCEHNGFGQGVQIEHPQKSRDKVAENNNMSASKIQRYLRLNNLISGLLDIVDKGIIPFIPAVDLSYLRQDEQLSVMEVIETIGFKVDMAKAKILRDLSESGRLTQDKIFAVLSGEYSKKKKAEKPAVVKLKPKLILKFFTPEQKPAEIEEIIEKALTLYFEKQQEVQG